MKKATFLMLVITLLVFTSTAFAYGNFWCNKNAGIEKMTKIAVFPIEGYAAYDTETSLNKRLTDKVKDVYFVPINENASSNIISQNTDKCNLLAYFPTEQDRGKAVDEYLAADAYIICRVIENSVQQDWSPEKWVTVDMKSYTQVTDSPQGSYKCKEQKWQQDYLIEGGYVNLHSVTLEFTMYNTNGEKIMIFSQSAYGYNSASTYMNDIIKEFTDDFKKVKKVRGKK